MPTVSLSLSLEWLSIHVCHDLTCFLYRYFSQLHIFDMAILRYFTNFFTFWKRRLARLVWRSWRSFSTRYKGPISRIRVVLSNELVIAALAIIISVTLVGCVYFVFQSRNKFVSEFKFLTGWWKVAGVNIAVLDSMGHVNYPDKDELHDGDNPLFDPIFDPGSSIVWKVDGLTKYAESLAELNSFMSFEKFSSVTRKNQTGFWIFLFGPDNKRSKLIGKGNTDDKEISSGPSIRAFKITEHLVNSHNIQPEDLEVAVSLRAYVEGEAAVVIRYEDSLTKNFHLERLSRMEFKEDGFCNKILNVPFDKRVNMVYIRPTSTNLRKPGMVIIDKVIIAVATRNITENLIYSMAPQNWC